MVLNEPVGELLTMSTRLKTEEANVKANKDRLELGFVDRIEFIRENDDFVKTDRKRND